MRYDQGMEDAVTVTGSVVEIVYVNEDNGYTVCEIDSPEEGLFTATGYMPYINEGENIELQGHWVEHREYGEQFSAVSYHTLLPTEKNAVLMYLSSGIIPGIRAATAKKIVERFGEDSFNVILNYPERLSEIKGITKEKAERFSEEFKKVRSVSSIVIFLQQFGISAKTATKVHKILGSNAVEKIRENPYILADRVDGITFKTADNIAHLLGLAKNMPERIASFTKYTLTRAAYQSGHTYLPKEQLIEYTENNLGTDPDDAEAAISSLVLSNDVYVDSVGGDKVCYLSSLLSAELYIARRIVSLSYTEPKYTLPPDEASDLTDRLAAEEGMVLAAEQRDAVLEAVMRGLVVITGGPGTGKTTTINLIIKLMKSMKQKIALAAPTGRAAKRMSEVTGMDAKTIHRLLGVVRSGGEEEYTLFTKNESSPLSADVLILDEVSMIDINLMSAFLRAVKPGARVILVGDADQLPPVGPGNILRDIISSGAVPVVKLSHIFRQAQESLIVVNAHRINKGERPVFQTDDPDFFYIRRKDPSLIANTIASLYKTRLPDRYKIDPLGAIQVLCPSRKGTVGAIAINKLLQDEINPADYMKSEVRYGNTVFRVGDKVMQIKNNYDIEWITDTGEEGLGIFNGDTGTIQRISSIDKVMDIVFDENKTVEYSFSYLDELDLAYAVTVHKSQGNEYPFVIIPVSGFSSYLMYRNLLYTAVTRARQMVILVGDEAGLMHMIENNERSKRYSGLLYKIAGIKELYESKEENEL